MSSWIIALYPVLILALAGVAFYEHQKSVSLSLPVSPVLTVLTILLPLLAALHAFFHPSLLALSRATAASPIQKLLPTLLQALQLILTTILATLLASDAIPSPVRDCLLETRWKGFWTGHDADSIRRVQDALNCCGFNSMKDRAWPFPHGAPEDGAGENCAEKFGRTVACREPWKRAMQGGAGLDGAVVVAVGLLQVLSWVMGRRWAKGRSRDYLTLKLYRHGITRSEIPIFRQIRHHTAKRDPLFAAGHTPPGEEKLFPVLCYIIHTADIRVAYIKEENILTGIPDKRAFEAFFRAELETPSARKLVGKGSVLVYQSRTFGGTATADEAVAWYSAVLGDLLGAADGNDVNEADLAQPVCYRAPEVNFGMAWSYPVDVWNLGLVEGHNLFEVSDNKDKEIQRHLAEVVGMLGPPPRDRVQRIKRDVFLKDGEERNGGFLILKPDRLNLDKAGKRLDEDYRVKFVAFLKSMQQWRPEDRKTARELLSDPWLALGDA
ncbi:hypothetical protein B0T18DRAFT_485975 [Schizothecium vesticola]|uniref:Uncharacterized protein n=1 Tax=Schizothecium vesticola TaxID=314040 RepID=A0AA40F505_9PEZI|nr:hypothetical protein B0T18DRAFT_485975 [Schizothecium vesticola]